MGKPVELPKREMFLLPVSSPGFGREAAAHGGRRIQIGYPLCMTEYSVDATSDGLYGLVNGDKLAL
jgi:hypothetical protein